MLINVSLLIISIFFNLIKILYTKLNKKYKFQTFPGFILSKTKIDFLKLYLNTLKVPLILVTGTNGKTSTTNIINHILTKNNYLVLSNLSGSNLKRGILSTLVLNYYKFFLKKPSYCLFEIDEGTVLEFTKSIPKSIPHTYILLLNLSRDQLDRFGEIDTTAFKIGQAASKKNITLIASKSSYSHYFGTYNILKNLDNKKLVQALKINNYPHLIANLNFVTNLFLLLKPVLNYSKVTPYLPVAGRGSTLIYKRHFLQIHLSKNPVSFNNNLKILLNSDIKHVLVFMNDFIQDGRDVSWFYDINYRLIRSAFKNRTVFVAGSRSYDFYNFLKINNIAAFNILNFSDYLVFAQSLGYKSTFVLSNYSATFSITSYEK